MVLRNLPLRDGDITAQTRFRSEEVVETEIAPPFSDVKPDGEQLLRRIEQKTEIHAGQFIALAGQGF